MTSRYDIMSSSSVIDSEDWDNYPDPLSINWNSFTISSAPYTRLVEKRFIEKPWLMLYFIYEITELDDFVLTFNNVPYRSTLEAGDHLLVPLLADMQNFITASKLQLTSI